MKTIDLILKLIPLLGIIPFLKAIWEYSKDLKWKKSEYLAKEVKEFNSTESVKIVFQLLDWNRRIVKLKSGECLISDADLTKALLTHDKKSTFTKDEAEIRDIFDEFFDKLSTFNIYINNGLISAAELYSYIGYYVDILTSTDRKPKELIEVFDNYIEYYRLSEVRELIEKFNELNRLH